jgi:hypothetical protein
MNMLYIGKSVSAWFTAWFATHTQGEARNVKSCLPSRDPARHLRPFAALSLLFTNSTSSIIPLPFLQSHAIYSELGRTAAYYTPHTHMIDMLMCAG